MRKTVLEQSKEFININSRKKKFVFSSSEIKVTIKNFLVENWYLVSPIKNIFILKKSGQKLSEILNIYKFEIIEKLLKKWDILSWEFLINYYLWKTDISTIFRIITKSKNFISYLWEENNLKFIFKPSRVVRNTKKIIIWKTKLEIEEKLSFIINNYYLFKDNKDFQKILLETEIETKEIEKLIKKKFKFSAISKIAIFYKNNWQINKYNSIILASKKLDKKIDRRWTKVQKKDKIKKKVEKNKNVDLNDLF